MKFGSLDTRGAASRLSNKILNRAPFLSAFAALAVLKGPLSNAFPDKKPAEYKKHKRTLIALARRRCKVLFAMLHGDNYYHASEVAIASKIYP